MANVSRKGSRCRLLGCENQASKRGLCDRHYRQLLAAEHPKPCIIAGCKRQQKAHGWCELHWRRWRMTGDPLAVRPGGSKPREVPRLCDVEGCDRVHYGRGLCKRHYMQLPDQQRTQQQYEKQRRLEPARRESERDRNHERRVLVNAWLQTHGRAVRRSEILKRDRYRCQLCGRRTQGDWPDPRSATLDHIIPISRGGSHTPENLQCACLACNTQKGTGAANDQMLLFG